MNTAGRAAAACLLMLAGGCERSYQLAPFSSDGCSLFPDESIITQQHWQDCCLEHDIAYWRGGTREQRQQADAALRRCVADKTGNEELAELMYEGVRVGGSPYFYNWYRWGYGWNYGRNYQPLTADEQRQADALLQQHFDAAGDSEADRDTR